MSSADRCVICGAIVPEGRMICPTCEAKETCKTCKWHDDFTWVCCNGYSDKCAEPTDNNHSCYLWEVKGNDG